MQKNSSNKLKNIFRQYDIRGIFSQELDQQIVEKIGFFLAKEVLRQIPNAKFIAIGYDARVHSKILFSWLCSGINASFLKVLDMGLVPTPVNYFAPFCELDDMKIDATIMITGSHNPPEYNGFKITIDKKPYFGEDLYHLGEKVLSENLQIIPNHSCQSIDIKSRYIEYLSDKFHFTNLKNKRFIFDCGNGVAGVILKELLPKFGLNAKLFYEEPDGTFPNHHPDPSEDKNLIDIKNALKNDECDYAFAYDGDADRIAFLSKKHNFKGDMLAIFFAKNMQNPLIIGEVKCSSLMYDEINKIGKAYMYKTGHSNLKVKLKELNAHFAAELSGHLFFNDRYFGFDDAIYATLRILELLDKGFDFDLQMEQLPKMFTSEEIGIQVSEEEKFLIIEKLKIALANVPKDFPKILDIIDVDGVRVIFSHGFGLIRASNTTPKLVTRFEATDEKTAKLYQDKLMEILEKIK